MEEHLLLSEVTNVLQPLQSQLLDALGKYIQSKTTCDQQLAKYMSQMQSIIDMMKKVHFVKPISSVNNIQDIIDLEIFVTKLRQFSQVNVHTGSYVVYVMKQNEEVADRLVDIVAEACADNEALKYTAINTYYAIIAYTIQVLDEHKFFGTLLADLHYNKKEFHAYTHKLISTFVDTDSGANKQVTAGSTPTSPGDGEDEKREQESNFSSKVIAVINACKAEFKKLLHVGRDDVKTLPTTMVGKDKEDCEVDEKHITPATVSGDSATRKLTDEAVEHKTIEQADNFRAFLAALDADMADIKHIRGKFNDKKQALVQDRIHYSDVVKGTAAGVEKHT